MEDQAEERHLTCTILRNMGFAVREAGDASEAIAAAPIP
jgi:CheY-like chemotaxis protein